MSDHEVMERFWESAGFSVHIVHLPEKVLNDKLAVLSDGSGRLSFVRYDQFLLNSCVLDGEKIFRFIDTLEDSAEKMLDAAMELRALIFDVNPLLDPEILVFNNENVLKIVETADIENPNVDIRRLVDNLDWDKPDFGGPSDEDIEEFFSSLPPPVFPVDLDGMGEHGDPNKMSPIVWDEADQIIVMITYDLSDMPDIFKDKYVFPHEEAYKTYIVTRCVYDFENLFLVLDRMGKTDILGGADKIIDKLYALCIHYNPFLSWDEIDLDKVKRLVYRKHGKPGRGTPPRVPTNSNCGGCATPDTKTKTSFKEFEDLSEEEVISLRDRVKNWVIGQDGAVNVVCDTVEMASCGMKDLHTPLGVFMLTGESGVGKTYLARMLSQELCGDEHSIIRIDGSEYSQAHEVSKLIGSPSGYVGYDDGGYLTNALVKSPFAVVLFDEIEKAHSKLHNILLQVMDEGRLTSNKGETVSFGQTIILMTSNLGVKEVKSISSRVGMGDTSVLTQEKRERAIKEALKNKFKPEFLNRIDGVITFHSLEKAHCLEIIKLAFKRLNEWTLEKNVEVTYTNVAADHIYQIGFTPGFGARPLKRAMKKEIMLPISRMMLTEKKRKNITILVDANASGLTFTVEDKEEIKTEEEVNTDTVDDTTENYSEDDNV